MAFDAHKNFAVSTVATAPSPASSGTSLVVASGDGGKFPATPFNAVIWPTGANPLSTNAEIVRVTTISTDTFTITRAQESSSARSVVIGDQIMAALTAQTITDIEAQALGGNVTGQASSVDSEIALFSGTGGKTVKRATGTGYVKAASGVYGTQATPIPVADGGSGAGTLTGLVLGNGTSAFTTVTAPSGTVVGTTDAQTETNKVLSDVFMGEVFDGKALAHSAVLLASTKSTALDTMEVGSGVNLEVPATSSLEVVTYAPLASTNAFLGQYNWVETGCSWTADSAGSTLNATMSGGIVWIGGRRLMVAAVKSRAFTASKDTYVDFQDNKDGTASITYTEVTNNAASPNLANGGTANNTLRNAIIVSGASSIAAAGSINQGDPAVLLPIASSAAYQVADSLGNMICNRDRNPRIIAARTIAADETGVSSETIVAQSVLTALIPANRRIRISGWLNLIQNTATGTIEVFIKDGSTAGSANLAHINYNLGGAWRTTPYIEAVVLNTSTAARSFALTIKTSTNTVAVQGATIGPSPFSVELV